nr:hypothetical protein [Chroococcidiopsis sp. [FACHB-1243]]
MVRIVPNKGATIAVGILTQVALFPIGYFTVLDNCNFVIAVRTVKGFENRHWLLRIVDASIQAQILKNNKPRTLPDLAIALAPLDTDEAIRLRCLPLGLRAVQSGDAAPGLPKSCHNFALCEKRASSTPTVLTGAIGGDACSDRRDKRVLSLTPLLHWWLNRAPAAPPSAKPVAINRRANRWFDVPREQLQ